MHAGQLSQAFLAMDAGKSQARSLLRFSTSKCEHARSLAGL